MKKRVLSLFLALTLCLTLLPTAALATENETSAQSAELELVNADGRKYGDGNGNVTMRVKNATEHSPVTVTCTGGDDLSVGEHTVTATALSNENYKLPDEGSITYIRDTLRIK